MADELNTPDGRAGPEAPPAATAPAEGSVVMNAWAGLSLGTLVGMLIGLSSVPVVASAVGAVLALLVTFFGFARNEGTMATRTSGARFAGFGVAMAVALAGGIALRAHGALGPSFADRVARFAVDGMPRERALELAAYEHLGLRMGQLAEVEAPTAAPAASPYAFSGAGDPACAMLDADAYSSVQERLGAMQSRGGPWSAIARLGAGLPEAQAKALADAAFALRCEAPR
ncbi:MAG: hypothetical protein MUF08_10950 [Burkholderiaceae bacterium]|nr:hypothetical protein [Burkholderiaceae bacterium]MCU0965546.1 hypothetical protein [Burkholderiaceae bacterium]